MRIGIGGSSERGGEREDMDENDDVLRPWRRRSVDFARVWFGSSSPPSSAPSRWPPRPLMSNGPGAMVFILVNRPPWDANRGLTGAYLGSASAYCCGLARYRSPGLFGGGNCGKELSELAVRKSGDERSLICVRAAPRARGYGERSPSLGVMGDALRDSLEAETGVSWSGRVKGRSGVDG